MCQIFGMKEKALRILSGSDNFCLKISGLCLIGLQTKQIKSLPKNIIGVNRTDSITELAKIYSASGVFVNPTYVDNFPTTNIQSSACGTPVITYNTGGSPETIDDNTGIIIKQGDILALAKAVLAILKRDKVYYLPKCRNRAENLYNKHDRFNDYLNLYLELLKSS